jgi:hypothetical protein
MPGDPFNSEPFAGIGVADGRCEEAKAKCQYGDVQHGILLIVPACVRNMASDVKRRLRQINDA